MLNRWTTDQIPNLSGKKAIVTGANSGLGFVAALELAKHGCHVVLACRDVNKGETAKQEILKIAPNAQLVVAHLNLADFTSIKQFSLDIKSSYDSLSMLVNNAGVIGIPYSTTQDGHETVFQTNYLGQFLLTAELLPLLEADGHARVVHVASNTHHAGKIDLDNLNGEKNYVRSDAYPNSKLAGLMFAFELGRRLEANHSSVISVAAHPGYAHTNILTHEETGTKLQRAFFKMGNALVAQTKEQGALPILLACAHPDVKNGDFYGPDGFKEMRGKPTHARASDTAKDKVLAVALWDKSEQMVGQPFLHCDLPYLASRDVSWVVADHGEGYFFRITPVAINADVDTVWKLVKELGRYNEFSNGEINIQMTGDVMAGNSFHSALCPNRCVGHFIPRSTEEIMLVDDVNHVIRWRRHLPSGDYAERVQLVEALPDDQGALWHNTMRIPGKIGFFTKKSMGNLIDNAFNQLGEGIKKEAEGNMAM